jgi:hypothetical protein
VVSLTPRPLYPGGKIPGTYCVGTGAGLDFGRREKSRVPSSIRTLGSSSPWPGGYTEFLLCVHIVRIMRVLSLVLTLYLVSEYIRV